ncbi:TonB-linked SusC/RagA family outer membrane protein [Gelidibacter sediminis]|uniref:TonB-linked SusC/RagA family outer membrane protein n=1 Tax=Gelidibacter sediminis TaxID=1608710 RepID=A0A4R7Q651_9FLAO|nr:TonB-dependent receptor [Gelidibacter sediminis]TDU43045.1 TonB-linked SusC/RagA family outer membrane protein [Gelidibacter sediminis]
MIQKLSRLLLVFSLFSFATVQGQITVTGTVTDATNGGPIPGVNIMEKGTTNGVVSDFDGNYSIKVNSNATLQFSYVGYAPQLIPVEGRQSIDVVMTEQSEGLNEVIVVGYGTQKKGNLTGAISTIDAEVLEDRPVSNVMQAIQGSAPGLQLSVGNAGGEPGANMNINIRGVGNLQGTGSPLVIVDDIPLNDPSGLNNINPNDIESISVLKDAASSAIYGARAAFGVILVKTKTGAGVSGHEVTYSNNFIYSSPTSIPEMMNSLEFANYFNLAATNGGGAPIFSEAVLERIKAYIADPVNTPVTVANPNGTQWQQYTGSNANTDWFDVMYKSSVMRQQHNLSFSGNEKKVNYNVSGSFFDAPGIMNFGDDEYQRYTLNSKISSKMNDWFTVNANVRMAREDLDRPSYDPGLYLHNIARRWPTNGVVMPNGSYSDGSEIPFLLDGGRRMSKEYNTNASMDLIFEPIQDLKIKTSLYYQRATNAITSHTARVSVTEPDGQERYIQQNNGFLRYAYENNYISPNVVVSYEKSFNDTHNFSGLLGFQQENTEYNSVTASRNDLITDNVPSISTAVGEDNVNDSAGSYSTQGYFGRLTYNYKEKYLFEVNGRYDASSRFAADSRWDFFPSVSVGYNMAKEDFWPMEKVSMFKFRYSTGSIGNQDVANYLYISRMPIRTNLWWIGNSGRPNYTLTPGIISPNITWETVKTDNYGLDVAAFNNRLQSSFEYFVRSTDNMFGPAERLPAVLGTSAPQANNASIETKGFEFSLQWKDAIGEVKYNVGVILSDAMTTVTNYRNPNNLLNTYREGQKLGEIWGFETIGLYQNQDQIDNGADQSTMYGGVWFPGDVQYRDLNGDGHIDWGDSTSDNPGDLSVIGNSTPRYSYSINVGLNFKGFDFSMFWQGIGKRDVWAGGPYTFGAVGNQWQSAGFREHLDYWSEDNPGAFLPRPTFRSAWRNQEVQTRYLQNGAYLRLKNATIGYNFPTTFLENLKLKKLRLFVTGENLLTITEMSSIYDPEATGGRWGNGKIYPLQKSFSLGLNVQF